MSRTDEDLLALLDELEATLDDLGTQIDDQDRDRDRRRPSSGAPTVTELLRFTEQYTLPTLIAVLEATVESLRLFRGLLQVIDPQADARQETASGRPGLPTDAGEAALRTGFQRTLSDLRTALDGTELPQNSDARSILQEARELSAEIERRLDEGTASPSSGRRQRTGRGQSDRGADSRMQASTDRGITIDVTDPGPSSSNDAGEQDRADSDPDGADADVDVEAELQSIKSDLDDADPIDESGSTDESDATAEGDDGVQTDSDKDGTDQNASSG